MRRWMAAGLCLLFVPAGCADPDQKLRDAAAQAAQEAASEVNTTRLVVKQLQAHRLWSQPADVMVGDPEKGIEAAVSSFSAQQPSTEQSLRLYEQVAVLRRSGEELGRIGELAK